MIELLLGAGGGLAAGVAGHGLLQRSDFSLEDYRTRLQGLCDLVNYEELIDDGIVLLKNGGYLAAWRVIGRDLEAASGTELAALVRRVSEAINPLGDGWMLHVDAVRSPAVGYPREGAFPDRTTWLLDQERRALYESERTHYVSDVTFAFTFLPPPETRGRVSKYFFTRHSRPAKEEFPGLREFKATLEEVVGNLFSSLRAERLGAVISADEHGARVVNDALLRHLHQCVTCVDQPVRLIDDDQSIDRLVADADLIGGRFPRIGPYHVRTVSIERLPIDSTAQMLHHLNLQSAAYRWSTRAIFLDETRAEQGLTRKRGEWRLKVLSMRNYIRQEVGGEVTHVNRFAQEMMADVDDALAVNSRGDERFVFYSAVVVLWSRNEREVDEQAVAFEQLLRDSGCVGRIEDVNALEAFISTWPGHGYENQRVFRLRTRGLVNAIPITRLFAGRPYHPSPRMPERSPALALCATDGSTPYHLNLHVGEVGHTAVIGNSGAGKSTLLNYIASNQLRYPDAQVFVFDMGWSSARLCKAAGGAHYVVGATREPEFAPLADLDDVDSRSWAKTYVEDLLRMRGADVTPEMGSFVSLAIEQLALRPRTSRRMSDLVTHIQEPRARETLKWYCEGEPGQLIDAEEDRLSSARYVVFELSHLAGAGTSAKQVESAVLMYLFRRVQGRLRAGSPSLILIDEAWNALQDETFADKTAEWLRTLRKLDAAVVFATQSLTDISDHPLGKLLLTLCPTKIYLANPSATTEHVRPTYEAAGLNDKQIELVANMTPARDYYIVNTDGSRRFRLSLGPCQLALLGSENSPENVELWDYVMRDPHAAWWPAAWLRARGLHDWADYWERGRQAASTLSSHHAPPPLRQFDAQPEEVIT